jgi:AcrR family transcriptional regulator
MTRKKREKTLWPRSYRLGLRQGAVDEKRRKIVEAARELIMSERALAGFSVDAVAKQAGAARATVYNQFGNRAGLLEALFDDLARRGGMMELGQVFQLEDSLEALGEFVRAFGHFWTEDRLLIRRLHGMNALDAEMAKADAARNDLRRQGLQKIVEKIKEQYDLPNNLPIEQTIEILQTLTSFEFFDQLAGPTQTPEEVVPLVRKLILKWLGFQDNL